MRSLAILALATALAVAGTACTAVQEDTKVTPTSPRPSGAWFGGYVDLTLVPPYRLADSPSLGSTSTLLSFIVADPADPCEPSWGGVYSLEQANAQLDLDGQVDRFREAGNDVVVSFGGQLGNELATTCTDAEHLAQAYLAVISKYGLDIVDLDVEGPGPADQPAAKRRAAAIAKIQAARDPAAPLRVWLTLPVAASGLTEEAETSVATMLEAGVDLAGVNIMTMNFDTLPPGRTMLTESISAAEGTRRKLGTLYEAKGQHLTDAELWNKIGLTPMIGTNDMPGQTFTLKDAEALNAFALERGIGRMSFWSLNRDRACTASDKGTLEKGVSNLCSGVKQDAGVFAKLLGNGFTDGDG